MRKKRLIIPTLLLSLVVGIAWWVLDAPATPAGPPGPDLAALVGDGSGFEPVSGPWEYRFPADHGPHPDFHTENWYFTGQLQADDGRTFGFQLLLTRVGLKPGQPDRPSAWATHQAWRGQLVVSDPNAGRVYAFERFSRAALGLAGADIDPLKIWVENWTVKVHEDQRLHLQAAQGPVSLELSLDPLKPPARAAGSVGPFYGYAASRLGAGGTLTLDDETLTVTGLAWLDRAWGALPLGGGAVARDRLLLQLSDGRELTLTRLRRRDGSRPPIDSGALIETDGRIVPLERTELELTVTDHWESEAGSRYPAGWRLSVPARDLELTVEPLLQDQELDLTVRYWSGALQAEGRSGDGPLTARGHGELTGY